MAVLLVGAWLLHYEDFRHKGFLPFAWVSCVFWGAEIGLWYVIARATGEDALHDEAKVTDVPPISDRGQGQEYENSR